MRNNRILMLGMLMALFILMGMPSIAQAETPNPDGVKLYINDTLVNSDPQPFISEGRTMVPLRVISEAMGLEVNWIPGLSRVDIVSEDKVIMVTLGSTVASIVDKNDGESISVTLDVAPAIVNDRTVVPIRFISEQMAAIVEWDSATQTVSINTDTGYETRSLNILDHAYNIKVYNGWTFVKNYEVNGLVYTIVHEETGATENLTIEPIPSGMTIEEYGSNIMDLYEQEDFDTSLMDKQYDDNQLMIKFIIGTENGNVDVIQAVYLSPAGEAAEDSDYAIVFSIFLPSELEDNIKLDLLDQLEDNMKIVN